MSPLFDALKKKKKILVVDDDRDFAESVSAVITSAKGKFYETHLAYDATSAIKSVKEYKPDIIILDINLPDINGFRLCRTLRDDIGYQGKILMLTIRSSGDDLKRGEGAGADGYLQKPVSNDALLEAVEGLAKF